MWPDARDDAPGVVLLQGRREFIEKYFEVVHELRQRGLSVFTLDWRGQGLSARPLADRQKGHVDRFEVYLDDLDTLMAHIGRNGAGAPLHLVSHSAGAHIGLRYVHDHPGLFDTVTCSAPMIDLAAPRGTRGLAAAGVRLTAKMGGERAYLPGTGRYGSGDQVFDGNPLTTDRLRFERMHKLMTDNPDLALGGPTVGWVRAALQSIATLSRADFAQAISAPTLILCAADERVVSNRATQRFAGWLPHAQLVTLEDARHELFMERDAVRAALWRAIDRHLGLA